MDTQTQTEKPNTTDATAYASVYAGFFRRALACAVDSILFFVVLWFLSIFVLGGITFESVDRGETDVFMWFMLIMACLYSALMESSSRQGTLGKLLFGIRVTNVYGERLSFLSALGRAGFKIISVIFMFIGCIIALFTKKHQAFHDLPAGSIVVKKGLRREIPDVTIDNRGRFQSSVYLQDREKPADGPQARQNDRDVVEEWGFNGAAVKAAFSEGPAIIAAEFHRSLTEALAEAGLPLYNADSGKQIKITGCFIQIDEGNKFLRYLVPWLAGKARVEVEGSLMINGVGAAYLYAKEEKGFVFSVFGGENKILLMESAEKCGRRIAEQATAALRASQAGRPAAYAEPLPSYGAGRSRRQLTAWCEMQMKQGWVKESLLDEMTKDCPFAQALQIYDTTKISLTARAQKILGFGVIMFLLVITLTYSSYDTALSSGGGGYYLFFGAIILGPVCAVFGLRELLNWKSFQLRHFKAIPGM